MIIYGKQVCLHALGHHSDKIKTVYIAKKGILPQRLFEQYGSKIKFLENRWAQAMSKGGNHQGLLVEMEPFEEATLTQIKEGDFVLLLDGLTDVGNIGAIVRSAYALGVDGIIASGVKQLNFSAVARTSAGALLDMPFRVQTNILDVMSELAQVGFIHYGALMNAELHIEDAVFAKKRSLVLGSEDRGISKKAQQKLDGTISIGMKHSFDSLNVSAAAAIMIHRMGYAFE
jgi:23S rRNA (guanosine2251-2'-O)-methyltransferase